MHTSSENLIINDDLDLVISTSKIKKWNKGVYEIFCKDFVDIMGKADNQNKEIMKFMRHELSEMKVEMLQKMNNTACASSTSNGSISSFTIIKKCTNRKLLALPSSPSCANKRRNKNLADV